MRENEREKESERVQQREREILRESERDRDRVRLSRKCVVSLVVAIVDVLSVVTMMAVCGKDVSCLWILARVH